MPTTTVSDLETYRRAFAQEYPITRRLFAVFPEGKLDDLPAPSANSARRVAWTIALTQLIVPAVMGPELSGSGLPPVPPTWKELLAAGDQGHADALAAITRLGDEEWENTLVLDVGPKQRAAVRRGDVLRMFLNDHVHHRGQFSVHLRLAGAKVPSIYGPSGDEPWF
jgi:uncharacterized damage-inducible protein DinB